MWKLFYILSVVFHDVGAQVLKFKNDKSCSTKMSSKLRRHSILIASKISSNQANIATLRDCFTGCSNHANCAMFAHHEKKKRCMFFKEILVNEVLARLIFEGWSPGRINAQRKILLNVEDTCSEEYCQDSCLSGVKETCTPPTLSPPNCEPEGVYTGCDDARKKSKISALSVDGNSGAPPFDEDAYRAMVIEGIPVSLKCPQHVEYTRIVGEPSNPICFKSPETQNYGIVRNFLSYCTTKSHLFSYHRITGELKVVGTSNSYFVKMGARDYEYCQYLFYSGCSVLGNYYHYAQKVHLMTTTSSTESFFERTGFGLFKVKQGTYSDEYVGKMLHLHMINYFMGPSLGPFPETPISSYNFTNIPGAVKATLYENYYGTLAGFDRDALTPTRYGRYDNFKSFSYLAEHYIIILQTYFVPPSTGLYQFILVSDDDSYLYLSTDDSANNKYRIVHNPTALGDTDYSKKSSQIQLVEGEKYYMELVGREGVIGDFFFAGVILPNGDQIVPITYQYLEHYF
uniref:PA14 domain-containing protein n=1 Tax=Clytia hemisphaerica TaxID=252671 RepID=A0A7M5XDT1_9CNID